MRYIWLLLVLLAQSLTLHAAWYSSTGTGSGQWNDPASWSPAGVPVSGDGVRIGAGHNLIVSGDLVWQDGSIEVEGSLDVQGSVRFSNNAVMYLKRNGTLSVSQDFEHSKDFNLSGTVNVGRNLTIGGNFFFQSGSLKVGGDLLVQVQMTIGSGAVADIDGNVTIVQGSLNVKGSLVVDKNLTASNVVTSDGQALVVVGGDYTNTEAPTWSNNDNIFILGDSNCIQCDDLKDYDDWVEAGKPGGSLLNPSVPDWWTDHLVNANEPIGTTMICLDFPRRLAVTPVAEASGNLGKNIFEWHVYGGIIEGADRKATLDGVNISALTLPFDPGKALSTINVVWDSGITGHYAAVMQIPETECMNSKWSVTYIVFTDEDWPADMSISGPLSACVGDQVSYSAPAVEGARYNWILPTGWEFTGPSDGAVIQVVVGASGPTEMVQVEITGNCGLQQLQLPVLAVPLPDTSAIYHVGNETN